MVVLVAAGDRRFDDEDALGRADLDRRQPGAVLRVHGLDHVGDQLLGLVIDGSDGSRRLAQEVIGIFHDPPKRHLTHLTRNVRVDNQTV